MKEQCTSRIAKKPLRTQRDLYRMMIAVAQDMLNKDIALTRVAGFARVCEGLNRGMSNQARIGATADEIEYLDQDDEVGAHDGGRTATGPTHDEDDLAEKEELQRRIAEIDRKAQQRANGVPRRRPAKG